MFNFNAYCFCPNILAEKISDTIFFNTVLIPSTINSHHHLLLDRDEELWLEYLEKTQDDPSAYTNLNTWDLLLKHKSNKILYSNVESSSPISPRDISDLIVNAPATCHKYLVTNDNDLYIDSIGELSTHGVGLLSSDTLEASANINYPSITYNPSSFFLDLLLALSYVSNTRKNKLEDEHNDYLRDLLSIKGYDVYDQTRLGESSTRLRTGNLDLVIKSNRDWVTIIEPLRLSSVDSSNILEHYNKLIDNYNPLRLAYTHLVVYYMGAKEGFLQFFVRYKRMVTNLESDQFDGEIVFNASTDIDSNYQSLKTFTQSGTINGHVFHCSHTCICFSD